MGAAGAVAIVLLLLLGKGAGRWRDGLGRLGVEQLAEAGLPPNLLDGLLGVSGGSVVCRLLTSHGDIEFGAI